MRICPKCNKVYGESRYQYCYSCGAETVSDIEKKSEGFLKNKLISLDSFLDFFFENRNEFVIDIDLAIMDVKFEQNLIRITLNDGFNSIQHKRIKENE